MRETEGDGVGRLVEATGAASMVNSCFSLLRSPFSLSPSLHLSLSLFLSILSLSLSLFSLPPSVSSIYILLLKSVNFDCRKGGRVVLIGLPKVFTWIYYSGNLCEDFLFGVCSALFAYRAAA